ncbi:unnamed protein product [Sphagnum balticum]
MFSNSREDDNEYRLNADRTRDRDREKELEAEEDDETMEKQYNNELQNIRGLIRLTSNNIEALNARFANYQHPPSMYVAEYEDLTSRLNEFQSEEARLVDCLADVDHHHHNHHVHHSHSSDSCPHHEHELGYHSSHSNNSSNTNNTNSTSTSPCSIASPPPIIRSSPGSGSVTSSGHHHQYHHTKSVVRAHLPNQQRTTVEVIPGITVRDALSKAMRRRKLTANTCVVFRMRDRASIDWDAQLSCFEGEEVIVETRERFATTISHNFQRKTFFSLAFCEVCHRLLFHGFRCNTCGFRFHQRCAPHVPPLCRPLRVESNYLCHLLALNDQFHPLGSGNSGNDGNGSRSGMEKHSKNRYNHSMMSTVASTRERSTSAPNVCINAVSSVVGNVSLTGGTSSFSTNHSSGHNHGHSSSCSSPTRTHCQSASASASGSPTTGGSNKNCCSRPRARSADESAKKSINREGTGTGRESSIEDWEIPADEILQGPRIGSGSFGTVYRGHWHGPVALKKLNVSKSAGATSITPQQLEAFKNEVAVLRKTRHVNVLLFMGCVSRPQLTIVTQWCEGSSLYKHLHVIETKFELLQTIDVARQTAQGMDYLHAKSIIHRDLKSNNIFLHDDLTVKIGDFGLATVKTRFLAQAQQCPTGSVLWMSPEVVRMRESNPYSFQSDVYAFGVVLFELMTSSLPYTHLSQSKDAILFMVGRGLLRPDLTLAPPETPKALIRLAADCLQLKRDDRPLFRSILASLEQLVRSLPRIHRSASEPMLSACATSNPDDCFNSLLAGQSTPKTPEANNIEFSLFNFNFGHHTNSNSLSSTQQHRLCN